MFVLFNKLFKNKFNKSNWISIKFKFFWIWQRNFNKKSKIPVIFQTFESEMNIELFTIDENITNEISEKIKNIKFKGIKTEKSEIS